MVRGRGTSDGYKEGRQAMVRGRGTSDVYKEGRQAMVIRRGEAMVMRGGEAQQKVQYSTHRINAQPSHYI